MPVQLISVICRYGLEDNISIDHLKTEALCSKSYVDDGSLASGK